jgi:hypothetical protein
MSEEGKSWPLVKDEVVTSASPLRAWEQICCVVRTRTVYDIALDTLGTF